MTTTLAQALAGVRVLDASRVLAGPFAAQILGDLGADVIKVEQPRQGDETRGWGPPFVDNDEQDLSAYFLACNRSKRAVTVDLKQQAGRELFLKLAAKSDVVIENFRADSVKKLGLSAKDLHAVNPRLVVVSLSGYGRAGKDAERPGYDFVIQGLSGMMAATGPIAGPPSKFGVAIADLATGHYAAIAALAALHARQGSGEGMAIELALLDSAVATMANVAQAYLTSGKVPARQGNAHLQIVPYEAFDTKDGQLILAVGNDAQWAKLVEISGDVGLKDARFAKNADRVKLRSELTPRVELLMKARTTGDWLKAFDAAKIPAGPIWRLDELFQSDLARERGLVIKARRPDGSEVPLVGSPLVSALKAKAPPRLGEHTDQVLQEVLGLSGQERARLRQDGVI